ncbi:MAG: ATP-binding protein [Planctomycetales bacterium]|nr:ATP-binding protein [Planctomycetales bacterium]
MALGDSGWTLNQEIPSDTSFGSVLVDGLLDAMTERRWTEHALFQVQLAYEEAITNAIRHGNGCEASKSVNVEMKCDDYRVWIQITDQGDGFDPQSVPDPRQDELLEVPGGRGVLIIGQVMSEVRYNSRGNQVTMVKFKHDDMPRPCDGDDGGGN